MRERDNGRRRIEEVMGSRESLIVADEDEYSIRFRRRDLTLASRQKSKQFQVREICSNCEHSRPLPGHL